MLMVLSMQKRKNAKVKEREHAYKKECNDLLTTYYLLLTTHAQKMVPQISIEPPPFVVYTDEVGRRVDDAARCEGRVGSDSSDETVDASSRRSAICGSAARVFWGVRSAPAIER